MSLHASAFLPWFEHQRQQSLHSIPFSKINLHKNFIIRNTFGSRVTSLLSVFSVYILRWPRCRLFVIMCHSGSRQGFCSLRGGAIHRNNLAVSPFLTTLGIPPGLQGCSLSRRINRAVKRSIFLSWLKALRCTLYENSYVMKHVITCNQIFICSAGYFTSKNIHDLHP